MRANKVPGSRPVRRLPIGPHSAKRVSKATLASQLATTDLELTESQRLRRALDSAESRLRLAQAAARLGTFDLDVLHNALTCSDELYGILGYPIGSPIDVISYVALAHADDKQAILEAVNTALLDATPMRIEHRFIGTDGLIHWLEASGQPVADESGRVVRLFGTITDITERKRVGDRLAFLAHHDILTGLPNRSLLVERLDDALATARRNDRHVCVVFLDLDDFKRVNDTYGHSEGDRVIKICADRLRACTRPGDIVTRVGGDEFIVVLHDMASPEGGAYAVERMQAALAEPVALGGLDIGLHASFGISCYPGDSAVPEDLIGYADMAMYRTKQRRRGTYTYFEASLQQAASDRLRLEHELRTALREGQLLVHYQPIVNGRSKRLEGVEALVRWPRADGMMAPTMFIPLAEETGLIVPLGEFVLREACRTMAGLHRAGHSGLRLAVNLSPRQLVDENLVDMCRNVLSETGMPAHLLDLEITESYLVIDPVRAAALLDQLVALGIRIALDDFGTGYSSLSFLRRFPVHLLKLDRTFVTEIARSATDRAIVATILSLAHTLRMRSVAEGVETEEQYLTLAALGCESFQGFFFAQPMSSSDLTAFIEETSETGFTPAIAAQARR